MTNELSTTKINHHEYSFYPIHHQTLINKYKQQLSVLWTPEAVDMSKDREEWETLSPQIQDFMKFWLAFFSQADGIICENLMENFQQDIQRLNIKEAGYFYAVQNLIEVIHNETYSLMIETVIRDIIERDKLRNAIDNFPAVAEITKWTCKWMDPSYPLLERLVAFSCVEGIFFTGAFAAVYWIKQKNKLKGICLANEWIARDERMHTEFAFNLYEVLVKDYNLEPVNHERIKEIISSAMDAAEIFIRKALNVELIGLTADDMVCYVKCTADSVAQGFGIDKIYNMNNPFIWMLNIALPNKSNFFEKRTTEYARIGSEISYELYDDDLVW